MEVANIIAPRAYGLTLMPVRPRVRYCMVVSLRYGHRKRKSFPELYGKAFRFFCKEATRAAPSSRRATRPRPLPLIPTPERRQQP